MLTKDYPVTAAPSPMTPRRRPIPADVVGLAPCESCEHQPATTLVIFPTSRVSDTSVDFLACGGCADAAVTR